MKTSWGFRLKSFGQVVALTACVGGGALALAQTAAPANPVELKPARAGTPEMMQLREVDKVSSPLKPGNAAFVVSEITVKKVTDTRELERIKEALKDVDQNLYRLDVVTPQKGKTVRASHGALPLNQVVMIDKSVKNHPAGNAAFVVSEITVKKVTDTRELDRIKDALKAVDAQSYKLNTVRVEAPVRK